MSVVLGNIIESFEKPEDETLINWWRKIFNHDNFGSGRSDFNGWIQVFFPYRRKYDGQEILSEKFNSYLDYGDVHKGINNTPFKWVYYGSSYNMEFLSGFITIQFDILTKQLKPVIGWAVRESIEKIND